MLQQFRFIPPRSRWIECEVDIEFDCANAPTVYSKDPEIRVVGWQSVGFGISHEYLVFSPYVEEVEELKPSVPGCGAPKAYAFTLRYYICDKFGFGFNVGFLDTGTTGKRGRSITMRETLTTDSICCDRPTPPFLETSTRQQPILFALAPMPAVGFALVSAGLALLYWAMPTQTARLALWWGYWAAFLLFGTAALSRWAMRSVRPSPHEGPTERVG